VNASRHSVSNVDDPKGDIMENNYASSHHDYLIIGGGPAGLQLAYFLEKAGRDYLILEAGDTPGTFFKNFPRHRTLISNNKVYTGVDDPEINLRFDWNSLLCDSEQMLFKNYSKRYFPKADDFVRYLSDFASFYNIKIKYKTKAVEIKKEDGFRILDDSGNVHTCQKLIVASGFTKPYIPPIPGIELIEQYVDVSVDPEDFANQKVLILGKGNSAFETADNLIETTALIHVASPTPLSMAWKTHFVGHLRAVNNNFVDTYQLKSQNAILDAKILNIARKDDKLVVSVSYSHANGETEDLYYDRVIGCTGFRFDSSIFHESTKPELVVNDRFPNQTSEWESTNVKDLYFVGTLTQMRDLKKTTSGFIHGFRYNALALHHILEQKYHGNEWPAYPIDATPDGLAEAVIRRVNNSSALWQQFGFLCDLIVVSDGSREALYYEALPVHYVHDSHYGSNDHYYTITLEFGKSRDDLFNVERNPDPSQADRSTFLHPVIRRFSGATLLSEHHLLEDLYADWSKPNVHAQPLVEYISGEMLGNQQSHAGRS
jgi:thioredoxin reductase